MCAVFAVIPYTTFPTIDLGPLNLRTFGLMVALGVLLGAWIAAQYAERFGIERDDTYRVATWMVLAGIIGSRLTWAATHTDQIENPIDVIAIWEGGIQFSGGFVAALIVGLPFFRRWKRLQRWHVLDGYALGLALGLALGRVGCYSVGEHFGRMSDFFLATRYDGGEVREPLLGDVPLAVGDTFHNTALYEFIYLMIIFGIMAAWVLRARRAGREVATGTLVGFFVLVYGICRFLSDTLRVNDERVLSMTGAQWMSLVMIPAGAYILLKVRPRLAALGAEAPAEAEAAKDGEEAATAEAEAGADEDATEAAGAAEAGGAGEAAESSEEAVEAVGEDDADAAVEPDEVAEPSEAEATADEEAATGEAVVEVAATDDEAATEVAATDDEVAEEATVDGPVVEDVATGDGADGEEAAKAEVEEAPHPAK
jgi:phosphatidylglycerol---prolipoprotein diacylglyceryl transferase